MRPTFSPRPPILAKNRYATPFFWKGKEGRKGREGKEGILGGHEQVVGRIPMVNHCDYNTFLNDTTLYFYPVLESFYFSQ